MICGNCNQEIDYSRETVTFHLDGLCGEQHLVSDGIPIRAVGLVIRNPLDDLFVPASAIISVPRDKIRDYQVSDIINLKLNDKTYRARVVEIECSDTTHDYVVTLHFILEF